MKNKPLILTISILGSAFIIGGVATQAINTHPVSIDAEMKSQEATFDLLQENVQDLQSKPSKQMLANKTQISQVKQQLTQIKHTLNQLMLAQKNESDDIYQPEVIDEEIVTGVTVEEPVEDRQFVDHFASYLTNEVGSSEDDQESTSRIEQSFEAALETRQITGVSLLGSECNATLCKIELGFDDESIRERYSGMGTSIVPWDGQAFFHQSESEPSTMIYYVAKEGFDLAMPDPSDS